MAGPLVHLLSPLRILRASQAGFISFEATRMYNSPLQPNGGALAWWYPFHKKVVAQLRHISPKTCISFFLFMTQKERCSALREKQQGRSALLTLQIARSGVVACCFPRDKIRTARKTERRREGTSPEFLALKHESNILGHSSNPVCGFSMMEQVRL